MKKLIAILMVLSSLLLFSCNSDEQEPTDLPTEPQESESVLNKPTEEPTEEPTERPTEEVVRGMECLYSEYRNYFSNLKIFFHFIIPFI